MKTGVLVHGFHLQAENWQKIVWGEPPHLLGRVPKGVLVALQEKAEIIVFGTGASEKDDLKEAEYTRDYLFNHFSELAEFSAFQGVDLKKAERKIRKILEVEIQSWNTSTEIIYAGRIFQKAGAKKVILVSSPDHIPRCLRDACGLVFSVYFDIYATPSQTSWASPLDVIIKEPSHRPDQDRSKIKEGAGT